MRLEPVYLAPRPKPSSMPTRRAFLLTGAAFLGGAAIGGACGYSMGASGANTDAPPAASRLEPSGDAELDELRRLAVEAPIDELMDKAVLFLNLLGTTYRGDEVLWGGVRRIGREIIDNEGRAVHYTTIRTVIAMIEGADPPPRLGLEDLTPMLEESFQKARKRHR